MKVGDLVVRRDAPGAVGRIVELVTETVKALPPYAWVRFGRGHEAYTADILLNNLLPASLAAPPSTSTEQK